MAIGTIFTISAIASGIKSVVSGIWTVTKDFIQWMFQVMPKPLKFFFFIYFAMFLVSSIMPEFIGTRFACTSDGEIYKINFVNLYVDIQHVNSLAEICSKKEVTKETSFFDFLTIPWNLIETSFLSVKNIWNAYTGIQEGNYTKVYDVCEEFDKISEGVDTFNETVSRDIALKYYGEQVEQNGYENLVHVGCGLDRKGEYYITLMFYNVDVFNLEIWLLIGIAGALIPLAMSYYRVTIKH